MNYFKKIYSKQTKRKNSTKKIKVKEKEIKVEDTTAKIKEIEEKIANLDIQKETIKNEPENQIEVTLQKDKVTIVENWKKIKNF